MTSEQNGEAAEKVLNDVVRDADEYFAYHRLVTWIREPMKGMRIC